MIEIQGTTNHYRKWSRGNGESGHLFVSGNFLPSRERKVLLTDLLMIHYLALVSDTFIPHSLHDSVPPPCTTLHHCELNAVAVAVTCSRVSVKLSKVPDFSRPRLELRRLPALTQAQPSRRGSSQGRAGRNDRARRGNSRPSFLSNPADQ